MATKIAAQEGDTACKGATTGEETPQLLPTPRRVTVVDAETGRRVSGAVITIGIRRDTTAWDGTATIAAQSLRKATVWHPHYYTCHIADSLDADTIRLIPSTRQLAEVVVWGKHRPKDFMPHTPRAKVDNELLANQEKAMGFNPLGLIAWGVSKLLPRHPKLTKKEKQKIVMDNY